MFFIIISWCYIVFILYCNGSLLIGIIKKLLKSTSSVNIQFPIICIVGMAAITFLTMCWALLMPVNFLLHLLVFIVSIVFASYNRSHFRNKMTEYINVVKQTPFVFKILFICWLLVMANVSSLVSSHYDDGLYYSGSIKWLQEYGTVPGLANLNPRLGFNSSWLVLQSLFGFSFIRGVLFNDLNGLLYLLVLLISLQGIIELWRGNRLLLSFVKAFFFIPVLALHYQASHDFMLFNVNYFSSPSPDIPSCFITWIVFLLFIENMQRVKEDILTNVLIIILSVFLVTIKLSTVPVLIIPLYILFKGLYKREFRIVVYAIALSLLFIIPWLTRNVLVSGYLVFPFSTIDLFNVDWKLGVEHVRYHESVVRNWAINPGNETDSGLPVTKWFPEWFERMTYIQSVLLIAVLITFLSGCIVAVVNIIRRGAEYILENRSDIILFVTCCAGIIFWFLKGPDIRLGFGFLIFFCMYGVSSFIKYFVESYSSYVANVFVTMMFFVLIINYKNVLANAPLKKFIQISRLRYPEKVESIPLSNGVKLNLVSSEPCWNCEIPCTTSGEYGSIKIKLRGAALSDGFKSQ